MEAFWYLLVDIELMQAILGCQYNDIKFWLENEALVASCLAN